MRRITIAGGIYTILVAGEQSGGRYCLIDMHVPAGAGPPPHHHDFEEMFKLREGELEFTFRGKSSTIRAGFVANLWRTPHILSGISACARASL
jgi:mannose-6-phosphate isomerase-like protein (cupin superfamily)